MIFDYFIVLKQLLLQLQQQRQQQQQRQALAKHQQIKMRL